MTLWLAISLSLALLAIGAWCSLMAKQVDSLRRRLFEVETANRAQQEVLVVHHRWLGELNRLAGVKQEGANEPRH